MLFRSMDSNFDDALKLTNKKHDLVAFKIYDPKENELPEVGLITLQDAETGSILEIDSSDESVRRGFRMIATNKEKMLAESFAKSGVDWINLRTDQNYVQPLMTLFKKRGRK